MIDEAINFSSACGAARDQSKRGTCLAFASSAFNQHVNDCKDYLSVEYLAHHAAKQMKGWKAGDGLTVSSAISAMRQPGQPVESDYAYDPTDHGRPLSAVPVQVGPLFCSDATRKKLTADEIGATIKKGKPVCLILALSKNFFSPKDGIVSYASDYVPNALHAVVGVGLGAHTQTQDDHVLIRNSWGAGWGKSGHAWLPMQYLKTHLQDSFAL